MCKHTDQVTFSIDRELSAGGISLYNELSPSLLLLDPSTRNTWVGLFGKVTVIKWKTFEEVLKSVNVDVAPELEGLLDPCNTGFINVVRFATLFNFIGPLEELLPMVFHFFLLEIFCLSFAFLVKSIVEKQMDANLLHS